jgi:hypothetical protein
VDKLARQRLDGVTAEVRASCDAYTAARRHTALADVPAPVNELDAALERVRKNVLTVDDEALTRALNAALRS